MNQEERREFVRKHRSAVFGYNRRSDGPAQSIVYYVTDGDDILVSTMGARAKAKAALRLGKVSLTPYATFHSPPEHVHRESDISEELLHGLGDALPW